MRCPRCDADTPDGAKFCVECGISLKPRCPQCGADVLPGAKFCAECGRPLTAQTLAPPAALPSSPLRYTPAYLAEKILTTKTALEGKRRQVTVLFADLKSSLELLADRDLEGACQRAEQAVELARQCQQRGTQAWALWLLGDSMACQASPEVELDAGHYRQALALAQELGMRPLVAHCHRSLGSLYAKLDRPERASIELSSALKLYRAMGMTFWLHQAEVALAQVEER